MQKEPLKKWYNAHKEKVTVEEIAVAEEENVLRLDSPGYHSEDKNFNYFQNIIGKELAGFLGSPNMRHTVPVIGCAFSPDGTRLLSASFDQTIKLWDTATGKCIKSIQLPWIPYYAAISPTPPHLVITANKNGTLTLFDLSKYMGGT